MSKGGGGQTATTNTVTQTSLPAYAQPYFTELMNRGSAVTQQPYQAYSGPRIAAFTPQQNQAFGMASNTPQAFSGNFQKANSFLDQAGSNFNNPVNIRDVQQRDPFAGGIEQWTDSGVAQRYMNPYLDQVLQNQIGKANQQFADQSLLRQGEQSRNGALGGGRAFVQNSLAQRDFNNSINDLVAQGYNSAWDKGIGAFQQDRGATMSVEQEKQRAAEALNAQRLQHDTSYESALNSRAAGIGQLAQASGALGTQNLDNTLRSMSAIGDAGRQQQQQTQAGYDLAYQDFINQRDYERQNVNYLGGLLNGVPISASSNVSNYENPNPYSQLLGLGVNALALNNAVGGKA